MTESSRGNSWVSDDQSIVEKEIVDGSLPVSEGDGVGEITDVQTQDGGEDGEECKASVKMEGKGESYVLTLKVVLPGSSEPLTVMVSGMQHREGGGGVEGETCAWSRVTWEWSVVPLTSGKVCVTLLRWFLLHAQHGTGEHRHFSLHAVGTASLCLCMCWGASVQGLAVG